MSGGFVLSSNKIPKANLKYTCRFTPHISTVRHLSFVSRITLRSACDKRSPSNHSLKVILNVNIDSFLRLLALSNPPFKISR